MPAGKQDVQAMILILTCEHAFPDIPEGYKHLFDSDTEILKTHEAYDTGSFDLFQFLKPIADFSHYQEIGRLLVESNRSLNHKKLFSRFTKGLNSFEKGEILNSFYFPYRTKIEQNISSILEGGSEVLHISIHSFTPVFQGDVRNADIGLLYDPGISKEKEISRSWKELISNKTSEFKVRLNYPYLGKSDGFTTSLRKMFPKNYIGIELEVNQKWVDENQMNSDLKKLFYETIIELKNKA